LLGSGAQDSYYNLQVQGFREGHLSLKREAPPDLAQFVNDEAWLDDHGLHDLSYYNGKLYLYFGVTPALMLFWPYAALTGHYLSHKDATVFFFSAGFLAAAALLWSVWRRYFKECGVWLVAAGTLALGLANFTPMILGRCDVYEVAISCGYALTMLALCGVWFALHDGPRRWRWLAAASLAYGLAVGARPSLLFGAVILLVPVIQAWREKGRLWPLLAAALGPIMAIGLGLAIYNALRFDNPLEFGQSTQMPMTVHQQFRLRFLWYNFVVGFLEPAHWTGHFPFAHDTGLPVKPDGYWGVDHSFGVLTNIPLVWLALAVPLAWRNRAQEAGRILWLFMGAVAALFAMCALPLLFHDSMCLRYEVEFAGPLVLLEVVGVLVLERALAGLPVWRRAARWGWGLLVAFSVAFNLLASFEMHACYLTIFGDALLRRQRLDEAAVLFQTALRIEKDCLEAHNGLAHVLVVRGRVDEAISELQKALQLDPDNENVLNNLGTALAQMGRVDEAITNFQRAVQLQPDYALAQNNLGNALLQSGRVDEAIPFLQMSLQGEPKSERARNNLGNALMRKGRVDEAIIQYQLALAANPNFAETCNNLGNALMQQGRLDEAISQYQHALLISPDYAFAVGNLDTALAKKGRADERIAQLQQALELNPDDENSHLNLGQAFLQQRKMVQAISQYQEALRLKPADPAIQNLLAWLLATAPDASLRDGGKALQLALQANQETGGDNPAALHTLGAAYAEAGKFPEAVEAAQHALRLAGAHTNTALAATLQSELKLYQAGKAYHEP
jgi:tetratricopeptide (TPR) repeat protein